MFTRISSPWAGLAPLAAVAGVGALLLLVFSVRSLRHGVPESERIKKQGGTALLGTFAMEFGFWLVHPVVQACIRLRVHPDMLSWTSLVLQLAAAGFISQGAWGVGAWLMIIGAACDSLDGSVARGRGLASDAGEVLDAAVDRVAEMTVFLAFAWYYRQDPLGFFLACASCVGAVMVSYARAKGEAVGVDAKMGLMQRHERAVYLSLATLFSPAVAFVTEKSAAHPRHYLVLAALGLIALFSNLTGIQRTAFTRAELRRQGR